MRRLPLILFMALAVPSPTQAQLVWDAPSLIGPASPTGMSLFATNPEPGNGVGALAIWRRQRGARTVGYRAGVADDGTGDLAVLGGIDIAGTLAHGMENSDVDVVWWSGVGAGLGDDVALSVPLGIAVGWTGSGDHVVFSPYVGGHVALDIATGDGDAVGLEGAFDLGLDLVLPSGWVVRFGATMGGRDALALGVRIP